MRKHMKLPGAVLATGLVAALAGSPAMASEDFTAAWNAADAKRQEAAAAGHEWRDTGKMLKKARSEEEAGNTDKAMKLVAQAHEQSIDALAQAEREKEGWKARVPQ